MIKISITTCTTEIVAKWMIPTELKKENERDKKSESYPVGIMELGALGRELEP